MTQRKHPHDDDKRLRKTGQSNSIGAADPNLRWSRRKIAES